MPDSQDSTQSSTPEAASTTQAPVAAAPATTATEAPVVAPSAAPAPVAAPAVAAPAVTAPTASSVQAPAAAPQAPAAVTPTPVAPAAAAPTQAPAVQVVADTAAPVGQVSTSTATPADFFQKVETSVEEARLIALGIKDFSDELKSAVISVLGNSPQVSRDFIQHVLTYLKEMAPNSPVTEAVIGRKQITLLTEIRNFIENAKEDFRPVFNVFLRLIHETKEDGAFGMRHIFRGVSPGPMNPTDRQAFQYLMHLFRTTSDVQTRRMTLNQIDLNRAVSVGLSDKSKQRLITFYSA